MSEKPKDESQKHEKDKEGKGKADRSQRIDLESRVEELTADLQRLQADFANYKRRSTEEQTQLMQVAKVNVVTTILPLLDNVDRALNHVPEELADNAWAKGVAGVAKQAQEVLRQLGVEKIEAHGQEFDPRYHEAIGFEDGEGEHEVVIEELQSGYRLGDQVLRPSMVKVGKGNLDNSSKNDKQ